MTAWLSAPYIGTILDGVYANFTPLKSLIYNLDKPVDPLMDFQPFAAHQDTTDGGVAGLGFPIARWSWKHRKDIQLEKLKNLIPGLSAWVYIRTKRNDTINGVAVWRTYYCQGLWMPETEDKQAGYTLEVQLEFRSLIIQTELT